MTEPVPADISKLKNILLNAKKVMAAVEEKSPKKGRKLTESDEVSHYEKPHQKISTPMYDERDEREPIYNTPSLENSYTNNNYTREQVLNSKLPPAIKEAMLKTPIPKVTMPSKFSLEGLEDLIEKPKPQIRENKNVSSDSITISRAELNEMIDKRVNELLAILFTKTISEQAIKKTINTLMNEGKLLVKKRI